MGQPTLPSPHICGSNIVRHVRIDDAVRLFCKETRLRFLYGITDWIARA
ncbi:hypothetical protein AB3464_14305 [Pseudomonas asplenii]|nr:hypothetical protein [Pseudomonas fuscovaginae]